MPPGLECRLSSAVSSARIQLMGQVGRVGWDGGSAELCLEGAGSRHPSAGVVLATGVEKQSAPAVAEHVGLATEVPTRAGFPPPGRRHGLGHGGPRHGAPRASETRARRPHDRRRAVGDLEAARSEAAAGLRPRTETARPGPSGRPLGAGIFQSVGAIPRRPAECVATPHGGPGGSPSRTRTCDKPVNSRLLYQLSYRGRRRKNRGLRARVKRLLA